MQPALPEMPGEMGAFPLSGDGIVQLALDSSHMALPKYLQ